MSDMNELPIGPNPCQTCGGVYGEHTNDCKHWKAHPKTVSMMDLIEEKEELRGQLGELRARLAEVEKEREEICTIAVEKDRLWSEACNERNALREALEKYGTHKYWCSAELGGGDCDCGLSQALNQRKAGESCATQKQSASTPDDTEPASTSSVQFTETSSVASNAAPEKSDPPPVCGQTRVDAEVDHVNNAYNDWVCSGDYPDVPRYVVSADFARQLERDLFTVLNELERIDLFLYGTKLNYEPDRILTLNTIRRLGEEHRERLKRDLADTQSRCADLAEWNTRLTRERDEARRKATALNGVRNQMANAFNAQNAEDFWAADRRANALVEEWTPELAMALAERDAAKAERDTLAVQLNRYGIHFRRCLGEGKCTCGLDPEITAPN